MASILRLSSLHEFQTHHPLTKVRSILDSFSDALRIEIRSALPDKKNELIEFQKELKNIISSGEKNESTLNDFIASITKRLLENGFDDVVENSYRNETNDSESACQFELVYKRIMSNLPDKLKESLIYSEADFEKLYEKTDVDYYEYIANSTFREINSTFGNFKLSYKQRFAYILGVFLVNVPVNTLHMFKYLKSMGNITKAFLSNCQLSDCDGTSLPSVCEGISLALGYAIGISLHESLKQNANVNYLLSEDPEKLTSRLHGIKTYLLCRDSATAIENDLATKDIVSKFLGIDPSDLLSLPNAVKVSRILDFLIPQTVGYDFYPLEYDDVQLELDKDTFSNLIYSSTLHTIISMLQIQFAEADEK